MLFRSAEVRDTRARRVLVDVTGVPELDTAAVNGLLQVAAASRLMGARLVLIGISTKVAIEVAATAASLANVEIAQDLASALRGEWSR